MTDSPTRRLNILFTTQPATGHLRPLIPVALAAQRRGHRVAVLAPARIAAEVRGYGVTHLGGGYDFAAEVWDMLPPDYLRLRFHQGADALAAAATPMMDCFLGRAAVATAHDILALPADLRPDLIVRESCEFGGYLAAEALGIAQVSVASFGGPHTVAPQAVAQRLNESRTRIGLCPDPGGLRAYRHLHASFVPECFGEADLMLPNTRCYRHPLLVRPGGSLPPGLVGLDHDRPFVYAAFGTVIYDLPGVGFFLRRMAEALGELDCTALLHVGTRGAAADIGRVPDNVVLVESFVEQSLVMQGADLFVTHAGLGGVKDALRLGVPMVSIPVLHDQRHNAAQCERLGLGRTIMPADTTAERIAEVCADVLVDPTRRGDCRRMQRAVQALPGVDALVDAMQTLAVRDDPTPDRKERR